MIGSWPFQSVNNTLQFQMELKVKSRSYKPADVEDRSGMLLNAPILDVSIFDGVLMMGGVYWNDL
jgi:hypothetical protein